MCIRDRGNAGAAAVMPLASPIGSNKGLATKDFIQILIDAVSYTHLDVYKRQILEEVLQTHLLKGRLRSLQLVLMI